jgi:hypothetical protein
MIDPDTTLDSPDGGSTLTPSQFAAWLDDPTSIRTVLVEAVASVSGVDTTFYLSTLPFVSRATDVPANQPYRAVLIASDIQTTEQLSIDGSASMTVGDIGISNDDGAFDSWLTYVWTNRPITVLLGDVRWPRANFVPVLTGVTADIGTKSRTSVNLKIRDKLERLNVAITEHLLGGTGSSQGSTVPLAFGELVNITPLLIDQTTWQYQVHDGQINGLIEVRDNGVPIANDSIGWAALTINSTLGTFRLSSPPAGTITCSLQGDATGGVYAGTVASIVKRIVKSYGVPGNQFTDSEIDLTNFNAFDAAHPQPVGVSVTGTTNTLSVVQQVTNALKAQLTTSRAGLLQLQQIDFTGLEATFSIKPQHMVEHSLYPAARELVQASVLLTFCPNQTVQTGLQTSLPAEALALMGTPYQKATAVDVSTKTLYKLTAEPTQEDTVLVRRTDASAEAQRRLNLRKVPRTTYQFDGFASLMQLTLGQVVTLAHPRYNLAGGVVGIVVSMTTNWAAGRTTVGVMV